MASHTCFLVSMFISVSCRKIAGTGPDVSVDSKTQQDVWAELKAPSNSPFCYGWNYEEDVLYDQLFRNP